ncbi:MAG: hypothetical protein NC321_16585 [Clostridium sp.]|nr:hypothetical protein [Clostridium sp.]
MSVSGIGQNNCQNYATIKSKKGVSSAEETYDFAGKVAEKSVVSPEESPLAISSIKQQ